MPNLNSIITAIKGMMAPGRGVSPKDEVWLLDNLAFSPSAAPAGTSQWKAEYVVAFFKEDNAIRKRITAATTDLIQTLDVAADDKQTEDRVRARIAPFLRAIGPNMEVDIEYRGDPSSRLHIGPGDGNGIFSKVLDVPGESNSRPGVGKTMSVVHGQKESSAEGSETAHLETGHTYFAVDGGWGVISDIDDTIKITEVRDRAKLLKHTFVDEPEAVPGMSDLYKQISSTISTPNKPAPFIYLSASPYNLYPFLRDFVRGAAFPEGSIILRDMSWMDMESFVLSLTMKTQSYKVDRMKKVATWLPQTTWVCIGDSTQKDPESYAEFYQYLKTTNQGGRIGRIWIHKGQYGELAAFPEFHMPMTVVGVNPSKEESLNSQDRFDKAFKDVPKEIVKIFENAQDLHAELDALKKEVA